MNDPISSTTIAAAVAHSAADDNNTSAAAGAFVASNSSAAAFVCRSDTPTSAQLFHDIPSVGYGLLALYTICYAITLAIYFEEVAFFVKYFAPGARVRRTLWILAFFPGYATTSYIAIIVPRAGVLCDLVSNVFFVSCLYQFLGLMEDYLGGKKTMWTVLGECRQVTMSTPPCCCCCRCLPKPTLNRKNYKKLSWLVIQVTIFRTILQFIAAVLWTNGSYIPGNLLPNNAFLYLATMNFISTLVAMWGLMILKAATRPDLEERFALTGKLACIQLSLIGTSVTNIIIGILVTTNVIKCTSLYPSKARAEDESVGLLMVGRLFSRVFFLSLCIAHATFVIMMCLLGLLARFFYRRQADAVGVGNKDDDRKFSTNIQDEIAYKVDNGNVEKCTTDVV